MSSDGVSRWRRRIGSFDFVSDFYIFEKQAEISQELHLLYIRVAAVKRAFIFLCRIY